jgi:hypothetical protein
MRSNGKITVITLARVRSVAATGTCLWLGVLSLIRIPQRQRTDQTLNTHMMLQFFALYVYCHDDMVERRCINVLFQTMQIQAVTSIL